MTVITKEQQRKKRHKRVRRKVKGTADRPRLCVYKSRLHLYVQLLDDVSSHNGSKSLVQMTTNTKEFKSSGRKSFRNIEHAKIIGAKLSALLKEKGIEKVAFDRSGYQYHGVISALAESIREQGIQF